MINYTKYCTLSFFYIYNFLLITIINVIIIIVVFFNMYPSRGIFLSYIIDLLSYYYQTHYQLSTIKPLVFYYKLLSFARLMHIIYSKVWQSYKDVNVV